MEKKTSYAKSRLMRVLCACLMRRLMRTSYADVLCGVPFWNAQRGRSPLGLNLAVRVRVIHLDHSERCAIEFPSPVLVRLDLRELGTDCLNASSIDAVIIAVHCTVPLLSLIIFPRLPLTLILPNVRFPPLDCNAQATIARVLSFEVVGKLPNQPWNLEPISVGISQKL